jgi:hypothetical protein
MLSQYLGVAKNIQKFSIPGTSQARIPDFINLAQGYIAESKWVQHLTMSQQLRDMAELAR